MYALCVDLQCQIWKIMYCLIIQAVSLLGDMDIVDGIQVIFYASIQVVAGDLKLKVCCNF